MAKIGRNERCPCGSGKKYKVCRGMDTRETTVWSGQQAPLSSLRGQPAPPSRLTTATLANLSGSMRMQTEQVMADIVAAIQERGLESTDEINAFLESLQQTGGKPPRRQATTPVEQVQDLMYQAWEASGPQRAALARQALKISPDCADAYVLLAKETARTPEEAHDLYAQGVAAGERALGPEEFEDTVGHFWGSIETRPYMRARQGLAETLIALGRRDEAAQHYWEMLRLNPNDNQGVRYPLLAQLLALGDLPEVKKLLDQYPDDASASWSHGRALYEFRAHGDGPGAQRALTTAIRDNPFVPAYLLERKRIPSRLPDLIGFGDESEAIQCAVEQLAAWKATPGAREWLRQHSR